MKRKGLRSKLTNFRRQFNKFWQHNQWRVAIYAVITVFVLGIWGFFEYFLIMGKTIYPLDVLYKILQLFVLGFDSTLSNLNWKLEIARWLAPSIAAITAARGLAVIFREQLHIFRSQFLRKHIIICGLGRKGLILSQRFIEAGYQVVVIENSENNDNLRQCRDSGAIVLIGNAMEPGPLRKACLKKAAYLFCVCGDDGVNAGIVFHACRILPSKRRTSLNCIVHIVDPQLCRLIKEREFKTVENGAFRLVFFNLFDLAAISILETFPPFEVHDSKVKVSPHLLIVGLGNMGESLVVHTGTKWMDLPAKPGRKLKISIIDREAKQKKELLKWRYPRLSQVCQMEPLQMDINSKKFEDGRFLFNWRKKCNVGIIYVCLDNDSFALRTALSLHQHLRDHDIPIIVRMEREAGLAPLVEGDSHGFANIQVFGFLDRILKPELLIKGTNEILARAIHDEYRRDRFEKDETIKTNPALVSWDKLPETLKNSNRRQADLLGIKLTSVECQIIPMRRLQAELIEFSDEEIEKMAKVEHAHWMAERIKDGWKFGQRKDIEKKISPVLVPWDELPEEEKEKDRNPVRNTPISLAKAGFQIYRRKKKEEKLYKNGRRVEHANCRKKDNNR